MKRLLLIYFALVAAAIAASAQIAVESMALIPTDMTAVRLDRRDLMNTPCAVVRVQLATPDVTFEGNLIGDPVYNGSEYLVAVTDGTKQLKINVPGATPVLVTFADNGVPSLKSKATYQLTLSGGATAYKAVIRYSPENATVVVGDDEVPGRGGMVEVMLPAGNHAVTVLADGYTLRSEVLEVAPGARNQLDVILSPKASAPTYQAATTATPNTAAQAEEILKQANAEYEKKNYSQAFALFEKAANMGNAEAQLYLGGCYQFGVGVNQDNGQAVRWYQKAADQGFAQAQYNLGSCYMNGVGVPTDRVQAVFWYGKAADQGDANAQYSLGLCYENGHGVIQDDTQAFNWFQKAAAHGSVPAQYELGVCYSFGYGVDQDKVKAVNWYQEAAEKGHLMAQHNLGVCYHYGNGVNRNYIEAIRWYKMAAEQGDTSSQYNLGVCYENGEGVRKDFVQAFNWYKEAADQEFAPAQYIVGVFYEMGKGVTRNLNEAISWYRKAAAQGYEDAMFTWERLGVR